MGEALVALTALMALGAAVLAWGHVQRVARAASMDLGPISIALRRLPVEARLAELERRTRPATWEHRLAAELKAAAGDAERVAVVNDALAAVDAELSAGAGWPSAGLRIAVFGTLLCTALAVLARRLEVIAVLVVVGAIGALATAEAGRRAKRMAAAQRTSIDSLIEAALGSLPSASTSDRRRSSRRKSR
jgi:hypothetical protein